MIDHALLYSSLGWPVFPLRGKAPLGGHGVLDATTDERRVVEWWRQHPRANIGVRCSAWTVLDVDPRHGGDRTLAAWVAEHGRLPEGPAARTGSGGWHLLFAPLELEDGEERVRHPGGRGAGLDLCSAGHYIVAPPSVHPDTGREYRWVRRHTLPLPVMPAWLRAECVRRPVAAVSGPRSGPTADGYRRAQAWLARVEGAVSGQGGHDATYRVACSLVQRWGLSDGEAWELLVEWNQRCVPPWGERDLRRKLSEARRAA